MVLKKFRALSNIKKSEIKEAVRKFRKKMKDERF